jgi:hypothetical protein
MLNRRDFPDDLFCKGTESNGRARVAGPWVKASKERRAKSIKQRASSEEQRAKSEEQRAKSEE